MAAATPGVCRLVLESPIRPSCVFRLPRRSTQLGPITARAFNNTTPIVEADSLPPDPPIQTPMPATSSSPRNASTTYLPDEQMTADQRALHSRSRIRQQFPPTPPPQIHVPSKAQSPRYSRHLVPTSPVGGPKHPLQLTPDLRKYLPHLASQPPLYMTVHIHEKPYLVTVGDIVRLPFLMHGVRPGDVLRLDRATVIGSRDWTLRAGSANPYHPPVSTTMAEPLIGRATDVPPVVEAEENTDDIDDGTESPNTSSLRFSRPKQDHRMRYLDPRLFVCRATVLGVESEPMRFIEKTKQRNRKVKTVTSRLRNTVLRIREITVKQLSYLEAKAEATEKAFKGKSRRGPAFTDSDSAAPTMPN